MITRRAKKLLPRHALSLLVLFASLLMVGTMVARPSYGQGTTGNTLAQTPTPSATLEPDTDVHIRHERGLAEYESLVQDGSDLVQSRAAALGGTRGGLQITIDDAGAIYGKRTWGSLDGATAYRFRHYVDPNGLSMPDHSEITLAQLRSGSLPARGSLSARGSSKVVTRLQYAASCYRLYVRYVDDNGAWRSMETTPIGDGEHYIEVLVEFASSASAGDGRVTEGC